MLDFIEHYYEVTESNKDELRKLMIVEDIRSYTGRTLDLNYFVRVGRVLGNNSDDNPKHTGFWHSRNTMHDDERKKLTTDIIKPLMKME